MTTEHRATPEETAFREIYGDENLHAAVRAILLEASSVAYGCHLISTYCYGNYEIDDAYEKLRLIAAGLSDRSLGQLADVARAALAAGASVDPFDHDTHLGCRVYPANLHHYYDMIFDMIASIYRDAIATKRARRNPPDELSDAPF